MLSVETRKSRQIILYVPMMNVESAENMGLEILYIDPCWVKTNCSTHGQIPGTKAGNKAERPQLELDASSFKQKKAHL